MDDLISRQAAIDAIDGGAELIRRVFLDSMVLVGCERSKFAWGLRLLESCIDDMNELPSAQPEQRWIPCSERLPKAFEHCLWTTTDGKVVYHYCDGQFSKYIAWMPLPEPYDPLTGHMNQPEE